MSTNKNDETKKTKSNALVMAGILLAAGMLAAVALSPTGAMAQESDRRQDLNSTVDDARTHRYGIHVAKGAGIAIDTETGENFRSGFRMVTQKVNASDSEFQVKRGLIGISIEGERIYYEMLPETWKIVVSEDGFKFEARGQVKNKDGQLFSVSLNGFFALHTRIGNLWSINGTMEGEDKQYELHYVGISNAVRPAAVRDIQ